jgi:outer membrane protein OmpA-like peptidoglycan-associated protein
LRKSEDGVTKLGLFQAVWDPNEKKWVNILPLSLNNDSYSVEHPAISPDGEKLYYASDMPGGMGGMDLYVSHRIIDSNGSASWGVPVNLGAGINSPGLEVFPFVDDQGNLWYASNGIPGLGGLDIFLAVKSEEGFSKTINPGYPLNTRFDDFGLITQNAGEEGYFSSDRYNKYGNDDIYSFSKQFHKRVVSVYDGRTKKALTRTHLDVMEEGVSPKWIENESAAPFMLTFNPFKSYEISGKKQNYKPAAIALTREQLLLADTIKIPLMQEGPVFMLNGLIFSASGKKPVPAATAVVFNKSMASGNEVKSDQAGIFHLGLLPETDYQITITDQTSNGKCSAAMIEISTRGLRRDSVFNLSIPVYCAGDVIAMEDIYYDLNKYTIRPDAAVVLDKLLKLMNQYPEMQIEMRSHTDSRASAAYNLNLSDHRAKSAAAYLYSKGIARGRIIGKGYGETKLINKCADGIPCSEAEHQVNRRTEFKILKLQ